MDEKKLTAREKEEAHKKSSRKTKIILYLVGIGILLIIGMYMGISLTLFMQASFFKIQRVLTWMFFIFIILLIIAIPITIKVWRYKKKKDAEYEADVKREADEIREKYEAQDKQEAQK